MFTSLTALVCCTQVPEISPQVLSEIRSDGHAIYRRLTGDLKSLGSIVVVPLKSFASGRVLPVVAVSFRKYTLKFDGNDGSLLSIWPVRPLSGTPAGMAKGPGKTLPRSELRRRATDFANRIGLPKGAVLQRENLRTRNDGRFQWPEYEVRFSTPPSKHPYGWNGPGTELLLQGDSAEIIHVTNEWREYLQPAPPGKPIASEATAMAKAGALLKLSERDKSKIRLAYMWPPSFTNDRLYRYPRYYVLCYAVSSGDWVVWLDAYTLEKRAMGPYLATLGKKR